MNQKFNILYIDLLSPKGHLALNKSFLNIFIRFASKIDLSCREEYIGYKDIPKEIGRIYNIPTQYYKFNSKLDYRIKNIKKIKWILKNIEVNSYDFIFISSYETISFSLMWRKKIKSRVVILNHNNLDELNNKLKYIFFKFIPKYIEHVVFEEYMKKYLLEEIKIANRVWVIHHPIDFSKINYDNKDSNKFNLERKKETKIIFAPSGSNDEKFIRQLIYLQKKEYFSDNIPIRLLVKSKKLEYNDDHLIVTNKYLSDKEYASYFKNAWLILLPYSKDFCYRISGVLFDCFAFRKRFVASSIPIFKYYVNKYPGIGKIFNDINELQEIIYSYIGQLKKTYSIFNKVQKDYSIENFSEEIRNLLNGILK